MRDGTFRGCRGAKEARIEVERNWPWSTLRLDAAAAEGTKWARMRPRNKERHGERGSERTRGEKREGEKEKRGEREGGRIAREKPREREEKRSWDSGVDDQTPHQREKQQRRRRQKQRAALAVAEGGMPFIFSSLSSTFEALSHIFPKRGLEAASSLDASIHRKPRGKSSPRCFLHIS